MRALIISVFIAVVSCGISAAQGTTSNPGMAPQTHSLPPSPPPTSTPPQPSTNTRIAPGSVIPVQLTKSIDAKKVKTGDEVEAQVTEDLKAANGETIVPKNTKVIGRVTETQARNKEQKESEISIAFDHAVMKNGDVSMPMSIQAIIAPSYLTGGNNSASAEGTAQPSSTPSATGAPGNNRSGGMGAPPSQSPSAAAEDVPTTNSNKNSRQPITGNTQGVLGIPNLSLSATSDSTHSSVMTSEKNNVKLEGGTLLLLRVNQ